MLMLILSIIGVSSAVLVSLFGLFFFARKQSKKKKIAASIKKQYYADSAEKTWVKFKKENLEQRAKDMTERDLL